MKQFEQDDIIDVAFQTATDDELLSSGQQEAARQTDEDRP